VLACLPDLTIEQTQLSALSEPGTLVAYTVEDTPDGKTVTVPKMWGLANLKRLNVTQVNDQQIQHETLTDHDVVSNIAQLRPHQVEATEALIEAMEKPYGGGALLVLSCGMGKSVTALNLAATLKLRCLIVTHTSVLASQWRDAIKQYYPNARVGTIKQNVFDVEDATHVIASLKSVATRQYDMAKAKIGLMVADEVHHVCSFQMSRAMAAVGCRYRLGLSATPERPDGLSPFLDWAIGPIAYQLERDPTPELRIFGIMLDSGPVQPKVIRKDGKCIANIAAMINMMGEDTPRAHERQDIMAAWIRLCARKGRKMIILGDRIDLLKDLEARVRADVAGTSLLIGSAKRAEREVAHLAQAIFASYGVAAEGFDCPALDTIFLQTPRSGSNVITQCVGRIQRHGGKSPLVIDIVDSVGLFKGMFAKRCKVYKKLGGTITQYTERREIIT
jgi:superfamily II DNA or RNA helicase